MFCVLTFNSNNFTSCVFIAFFLVFSFDCHSAALEFCKTCIAMKFVDNDDDDDDGVLA